MGHLTRDFFIGLSNNKFLNHQAKTWGFRLGAERFVAGTTIESVTETVKVLNNHGISCTIDNLGEFVAEKSEANAAKEKIIEILETIHAEKLDCHISIKLTQVGLDIDPSFCMKNMKEILDIAEKYTIFVNIDMEDYAHYEQTLAALNLLKDRYQNIGTVMQAYLHRFEEDIENLKDIRIRLVKGAYKESETVAFQSKKEIDENFIKIAKQRLLGETFTSIATHDHHIINELKAFIEENKINKNNFEFQMLYGFRTNMQYELAKEGYHFCTYIPFGHDWFGYFMRRLAERPQNMNLVLKDVFYTKEDRLKRGPIIIGAVAASAVTIYWKRQRNKRNKVV